jgi:hypothetical protein
MKYNIDGLIQSLIGKSFNEIISAFDSAAGMAKRVGYGRKGAQRERELVAVEYSQFAKGALFFLAQSQEIRPDGVQFEVFAKLEPLVKDLVARKIAPASFLDVFRLDPK